MSTGAPFFRLAALQSSFPGFQCPSDDFQEAPNLFISLWFDLTISFRQRAPSYAVWTIAGNPGIAGLCVQQHDVVCLIGRPVDDLPPSILGFGVVYGPGRGLRNVRLCYL